MTKIALTDDSGGWFDEAEAILFEEDTYFDGSNHISRATGSQWNHQELYYTSKGGWVLRSWSQWQGSGPPTLGQVSADQAAKWLIRQDCLECDAYPRLPEAVRTEVERHVQEQEV